MQEIEKKEIKNLPLIVFAGILSVILWRLPVAGLIFFPFTMFVTYLHEASHGLMAIITGGKLLNFQMSLDTSGVAWTSGGFRPLIISAGYLGSAFWGSLLLIAALKKGTEKKVLGALSIFFLIFTVMFARNLVSFSMGLFFCFSTFILGRLKHKTFLTFFLAFLAVQSCFQSFNDIFTLVILSGTGIETDAHIMSREVTHGLIPPIIFAVLWGLISSVFFILALKFSFRIKIPGK